MAARYYALVSQALLDDQPPWDLAGLRLVEQGPLQDPPMRWCVFDDASAPEDLNGRKVEPVIDVAGRITGRQVMA